MPTFHKILFSILSPFFHYVIDNLIIDIGIRTTFSTNIASYPLQLSSRNARNRPKNIPTGNKFT